MARKPWAGRFTEETSEVVEAYTGSVSFDKRLWKCDIEGSIAHARMLGRQGIISSEDADKIVAGLSEIAGEIEAGRFEFSDAFEDIHMNIEAALVRKIGDVGGKLYTARSRNDQVALDLRLYLRAEVREIIRMLEDVERGLAACAEQHLDVLMPGYTHMQRAQPVLLSHHLMAYAHMFDRDRGQFARQKRDRRLAAAHEEDLLAPASTHRIQRHERPAGRLSIGRERLDEQQLHTAQSRILPGGDDVADDSRDLHDR